MDDIFSVIFFIWIAFALLEGIVRKKKMPPPTNLPSEDINPPIEPDIDIIDIAQPLKRFQSSPKTLPKPVPKIIDQPPIQSQPTQQTQELNLNFTPSDTMNAIILSEIFSKPKALRKR